MLTEPEAKTMLGPAAIGIPTESVATSAAHAARIADRIGFPVVLKVVSRDLPHKSDVGGVHLGLRSQEAVRRAYETIVTRVRRASRRARIDGVLVQPHLSGREVLLGATHDAQLGPVVVFGLGGTAVELLGDVAFRLVPIDERDARQMLGEIKSAPLLNGYRGSVPLSTRSIVRALIRLSDLMSRFSHLIREIEINPMMVTSRRRRRSGRDGSSCAQVTRMTGGALRHFFAPRSVAVVGASSTSGKAGHFLFRNLLEGGYKGRLYPVNPASSRVLGCKTYASITEVPAPVDLAFLVVSSSHVVPALRDCARRGVKAVTIVTAGFAEVGEEGRARQMEIAAILRQNGMRAVGPNSVGLVSAPNALMGSFVPFPKWPAGRVAVAAQTGIFTGAFADQLSALSTQRIGFSRSLCLGNSVDIDEVDFLEYAARDPQTDVVAVHLESFKRARAFLSAANRVKRRKPILVMKTGRTAEGAQAAASHSGALAARDRIVDAALRQYGVVRASTLDDFIGMAKALAWLPAPRGNRVGIVTLSGAMGVMAVDEMHATGLTLARFSPATVAAVARCLPDWQPVRNPADVWMALSNGAEKAHADVLGAVLGDRESTCCWVFCFQFRTPISRPCGRYLQDCSVRIRRSPSCWCSSAGGKREVVARARAIQLPVYSDPGAAVRALEAVRFAVEQRTRVCPTPTSRSLRRHIELP